MKPGQRAYRSYSFHNDLEDGARMQKAGGCRRSGRTGPCGFAQSIGYSRLLAGVAVAVGRQLVELISRR